MFGRKLFKYIEHFDKGTPGSRRSKCIYLHSIKTACDRLSLNGPGNLRKVVILDKPVIFDHVFLNLPGDITLVKIFNPRLYQPTEGFG